MKDSDDNYLYAANSNNLYGDAGTSENDDYKWTVAIDAITNVGQSTRKIQYNSANPRFAAYTSSQRAIKLYKLDGPSVSGKAVSFDSAVSATKASTLTPSNLTNITDRTCLDKPAWVSTVTFDGNTMNVTAADNKTLEARDGVIRVSVTGEEGTAGCDVAVSQPASVFTASSTANMNFAWDDEDIKSTTFTSTFELTDSNISVTGDGKDAFLITITRVGSTDNYTLEVMPLANNESGADYDAVVSVSRDELTPISINVKQTYKGGSTMHTVTFNQLTGCTYTVSAGSVISSSDSVAEGAEVTLTSVSTKSGYSFSAWKVTKADDASTVVTVTANKFTMPSYAVKIQAIYEVTDVLTAGDLQATNTTYKDFSSLSKQSSAVYAGKTAKGNNVIQMNAENARGIWTTTSGGKIKSVAVTWNSNTASGRTLNVYADASSFSTGAGKTAVGTIVKGTSSKYDFAANSNYSHLYLRSSSNALYFDNISITWIVITE